MSKIQIILTIIPFIKAIKGENIQAVNTFYRHCSRQVEKRKWWWIHFLIPKVYKTNSVPCSTLGGYSSWSSRLCPQRFPPELASLSGCQWINTNRVTCSSMRPAFTLHSFLSICTWERHQPHKHSWEVKITDWSDYWGEASAMTAPGLLSLKQPHHMDNLKQYQYWVL